MKKILYVGCLGFNLLLGGCVASQDEIQTLKIKVLNLETTIQQQSQNQKAVENELNQLKGRVDTLEKKLNEDLLLEVKTKALAEIEELKSSQAKISSQVEDLMASKEDFYKTFTKHSEELKTRIEVLELKVKSLEEKGASPQATSSSVSNETLSKPSNQTVSNTTREPQIFTSSNNATSDETAKTDASKQQGSPQKELTEVEVYNQAFDLYQQKKWDEAIKAFKQYLQKYPKGKFLAQSHYWLGEIYYNKKDYEDAILSYQKVIESSASPALKASAMYKQALSFKNLGDKDASTILLKRIIKLYPKSKEAQEAKKLLSIKR
ncbi:tol-pal system protein YbgF [Thermodesulfobacterium hveragerdense]|uniref:tol-pal system protein YbgF n=1 Tax=Thermodesulfobacterium hveragerdense TaxID=53424 RepID=UPI0004295917|nr:tol-pal system protein YbgF [Thermodesulfobacterium hveragerdense]